MRHRRADSSTALETLYVQSDSAFLPWYRFRESRLHCATRKRFPRVRGGKDAHFGGVDDCEGGGALRLAQLFRRRVGNDRVVLHDSLHT